MKKQLTKYILGIFLVTALLHGIVWDVPKAKAIVEFGSYTTLFNDANTLDYYKLENTSDSKGSNTLTNNNTVAFNPGKYNNAADFGATNTNKSLSVASNLTIDGGAITIAFWYNNTTAPSSGDFYLPVSQNSATTKVGYWVGYTNNSGTLQVQFDRMKFGVADQTVVVNQDLGTGTWYWLVLTYDTTTLTGYINGSSVGTPQAASGNGSTPLASNFTIGAFNKDQSGGDWTKGLVDDVVVANRAWSSTEISNYYAFTGASNSLFFGTD